jgi:hypothetical protein
MNLHPINSPVQVLIRTRPAELQKIDPSLYKADSILIDKLCVKLSVTDATKVAYLITKIADENKQREQVDIIFDYGVPADDVQPQVEAFRVKVGSSDLTVTHFPHPFIQQKVNQVVGIWRSMNSENDLEFPSRTDVQRRRLTLPPTP